MEAALNRNAEYQEFIERCKGFLDEIEKETAAEKYTYAELEEIEDDYHKLIKWLEKINLRDLYNASMKQDASMALERCLNAFKEYSNLVYQAEGLKSDS